MNLLHRLREEVEVVTARKHVERKERREGEEEGREGEGGEKVLCAKYRCRCRSS